jgi:hypothetical protein
VRLGATKRQKAGTGGASRAGRDETADATQSAIRAVRRNPLAARAAAAYSVSIAATNPGPKDQAMNACLNAPTKTRLAALAAAVLTSTVVLGATVLGMQSAGQGANLHVVALDRVVVTGSAVN